MTAPERDAYQVALAEVFEAAVGAQFYSEQVKEYVAYGDLTGAKRSKLMAEAAIIRLRVNWNVLC